MQASGMDTVTGKPKRQTAHTILAKLVISKIGQFQANMLNLHLGTNQELLQPHMLV